MGQFDSETDAALSILNYEEISKPPGGEFVEVISDLISLVAGGPLLGIVGGASGFLLKIRELAGASYASNLIFAITAIKNDLRSLYEGHTNLRERIESLQTDTEFAEAIAAVALRAMHTSVKTRLKRLARVVVNGLKEGDLEPERLEDLLRGAAELSEADICLLKELYERNTSFDMNETDKVRVDFADRIGSVAKLQAVAFVQLRTPGFDQGANIVVLLPEGKRFYERLRDIGNEA